MTYLEKKDLGKHGMNGKCKTIGSDNETQIQPSRPEYDDAQNNENVTQTTSAKKAKTIGKV
jgi:hypothetical protein